MRAGVAASAEDAAVTQGSPWSLLLGSGKEMTDTRACRSQNGSDGRKEELFGRRGSPEINRKVRRQR